jgi:hypothetical protein
LSNNIKKTNKVPEKKHYKNPTDTWWGKTIVWVIFFGMVGLLVLTLVLAIVMGQG